MSLTLHIRSKIIFPVLFICLCCFSQNDSINKEKNQVNNRQIFISIALGYVNPVTTGNNFVGNGMEGKGGYNIKTQVFIYKQFFVGYNFGNTFLKVNNQQITGNYTSTVVSSESFFMGYEFLPSIKTRLGFNIGFLGKASYDNRGSTNGDDYYQKDTGTITYYEAYADYEFGDNIAFFLSYNYRTDRMNIVVPELLQSSFNQAAYHTFGIGFRIYIGKSDVVSKF